MVLLDRINVVLSRVGLKPLTSPNLLYYYIPANGCLGYGALSCQMFCPKLFDSVRSLVPVKSVTNFCLFWSLTGTGLYMYSRPHLRTLSMLDKFIYSTFSSVIFNMGSMLIWAVAQSFFIEDLFIIRSVLGVTSAVALLHVGYKYVHHIDSMCSLSGVL